MSFWNILEDISGCGGVVDQQFHALVGKLLPGGCVGFVFGEYFDLSQGCFFFCLHCYVVKKIDIIMQKAGEEAPQEKIETEPKQKKNSEESNSESNSSSGSSSESNEDSKSAAGSKERAAQEREPAENRVVRYKYCCKICKHPDKSKKACVCVVPLSQRRADLGSGCRNCGCLGCSKEDFLSKGEDPQYHPQLEKDRPERRKFETQKKQQKRVERRRQRSTSRKKNKSPPRRNKESRQSSSRSRSPEYIDSVSMKFYNLDRSLIGNMIINDYQLNPILLGFGVPQRTYSYVFGRPK